MTQVGWMFYQAILPTFTYINLLLQRDALMIHIIQNTLFSLARKTLGKFIKLELLAVASEKMVLLEFSDIENQVKNSNLFMGFMTKQLLNKLSETIAPRLISRFCSAVRDFSTTAVTSMIKKASL